jgi:predicted RNase H-like nuclease
MVYGGARSKDRGAGSGCGRFEGGGDPADAGRGLAAAVVASEGNAASLEILTLDDRLIDAARREGFVVGRGSAAASE